MKVLALAGEYDGCTLWRVLLPFSELQRQGHKDIDWDLINNAAVANYIYSFDWNTARIKANYDAIILPRRYWPIKEREKGREWIERLRKSGMAIIYESDDDHYSDEFVRRIAERDELSIEEIEERRECTLHTLRLADGVTVSTQRLATMTRQYTDRPVRVVENYIDLHWIWKIQSRVPRTINGLTIGWIGSMRTEADLEMMAEAWERIAKRYPDVKFVVQGKDMESIYKRIPGDRAIRLPWMSIDSYPSGLVNIDIGCCPLPDTKFNRAKTFIKAMEYTASGAAVVASPTVYGQLIESGVNGFIAKTTDEWEDALSQLIENKILRRKMQMRLMKKIKQQYSLEDNAWRWLEAWDEIIGDFRWRQNHRILLPSEVIYA